MKNKIPYGPNCYDQNYEYCPYWRRITGAHERSECYYGDTCTDNCAECDELITLCEFLNYIEYGPFTLGDMCKICGINEKGDSL